MSQQSQQSQSSELPSLDELFAEADRVGNKYQTPEEIQQTAAQLTEVRRDIWMSLDDTEIDELLD